ncbi:MAG: S-methyl-5-thioribose-1-phosphate isomerase [Deltaproteobacteria bacterium]|nr:S-methyl-5-thioribose-1-phosphate isomerase [Deltaproteobacteria bacterium]
MLTAIRYEPGTLYLLDQRVLPAEERWLALATASEVAEAIRCMVVRGAPAIAIAAGYGLALAARRGSDLDEAARTLVAARPTAVNLRWGVDRVRQARDIEAAARDLHDDDLRVNLALGEHGATLLDGGVLTICNTGALATGGHGTALGMVRSAIAHGRDIHLYACETRPWFQGARLTAWECAQDRIRCTLVADGAAASVLASGRARAVVVGCDRVARNGDTANKLGTLNLAVIARHFGVPLYVAMPWSSYDPATATGRDIIVEERDPAELGGYQHGPVDAWNPAFDVTPAELVSAWVTETGVVRVLGEG